jgi:hypothetical protein
MMTLRTARHIIMAGCALVALLAAVALTNAQTMYEVVGSAGTAAGSN